MKRKNRSPHLRVLLIEPFYGGSHQLWCDSFKLHSSHEVDIIGLPARHWKWRMHGGAVSLATEFLNLKTKYDIVLVSDMLDLGVFLSLIRKKLTNERIGIYFHENQLTYPWSPTDRDVDLNRNRHYAWINYTSILAADFCWFNSEYHKSSFISALPEFLKAFPDFKGVENINEVIGKSEVLHLGLELEPLLSIERRSVQNQEPIFLWNHRWEYDKNPEEFFQLLLDLQSAHVRFKLIVCGERTSKSPEIFSHVEHLFEEEILHFGYVDSREAYIELLSQANTLVVTSFQDFFGGSVVEAMAAGCRPFLPNRLAYNEHVLSEHRDTIVYDDLSDVHELFRENKWQLSQKDMLAMRSFISRYSFSNCILEYDRQVVNNFLKL